MAYPAYPMAPPLNRAEFFFLNYLRLEPTVLNSDFHTFENSAFCVKPQYTRVTVAVIMPCQYAEIWIPKLHGPRFAEIWMRVCPI